MVPRTASVWYYFRQTTYPKLKELWEIGDDMAKAAAMMTGTELLPTRVLGTAWPQHFNKTVAEVTWANIQKVGMPKWSEADQTLAKALQKELGSHARRVWTLSVPNELQGPVTRQPRRRLRRHRRHLLERADGHAALSRRTSRACPATTGPTPSRWPRRSRTRASTAGAKVQAMTILDLVTAARRWCAQAWDYFRTVQTKDQKYEPLLRAQDKPAIELNKAMMERYRPQMRKYYYDPTRYKTYLEQLGIAYPTVKKPDGWIRKSKLQIRIRRLPAPSPTDPRVRTVGESASRIGPWQSWALAWLGLASGAWDLDVC